MANSSSRWARMARTFMCGEVCEFGEGDVWLCENLIGTWTLLGGNR